MLTLLKWLFIWFFVTAIFFVVYKFVHALITKPNLRYYAASVLKDVKNMYYRYHV